MGIRGKLLALLLLISVVPLAINAAINHVSLYRFGQHLSAATRTLLTDSAHTYLHQEVKNYLSQWARDNLIVEVALNLEAQQWLTRPQFAEPEPNRPAMTLQILRDNRLDLKARQYTVLDSGESVSYPVEGNSPGKFDLRHFSWYATARDKMALSRSIAADPITGGPALFTAVPLVATDGRFIGVTAISRPLSEILRTMTLPNAWSEDAIIMLVRLEKSAGGKPAHLRIVAAGESRSIGTVTSEGSYLVPDESAEAESLFKMFAPGQAGTARITFRGQDTHWAFGLGQEGEPFPVVIVTHAAIANAALAAERHVRSKTIQSLEHSGVLLVVVVLAVFGLALAASRRVTRPLSQLAEVARRLTGGDFHARTEIRTGDELEDLGQIFNDLGPKLLERERMSSSLALAGEIQQHLLPAGPPPVVGFDIFGGVAYCDETGGDYFDFIDLQEKRLGLAVGDVAGHGIGAALLMASTRGILRSHVCGSCSGLPALFSALNQQLTRDVGDGRFMTLFFGVLDAKERSFRWCSAGHGPVYLIRRRNGAVEELATTGIPLGIMDGEVWEEAGPIILESGDILLIGTDGVWETCDLAGDTLGPERLRASIFSGRHETAAEIYSTAMEAVRVFRGEGPQEDDLTLVVVKAL